MVKYGNSGGAIQQGKALYVERPADASFEKDITTRRGVYTITAPRQTGKSSLWERMSAAIKPDDFAICELDFRETFGTPEKSNRTAGKWTRLLLRSIVREFKLDVTQMNNWIETQGEVSHTQLITSFFSDYLRPRLKGPIIICFDEIDIVQRFHYFTDNLFEALRHLKAECDALDMSFVLIGINHPRDLMKAVPPSSFNIGTDVALLDFDADVETAAAWSEGYPVKDEVLRIQMAQYILEQTGGQPFLTANVFARALEANVTSLEALKALTHELMEDAIDFKFCESHFQCAEDIIRDHQGRSSYKVLELYEQVRKAPVKWGNIPLEIRTTLIRTGLVKERERHLEVKSPFHRAVCDQDWIDEQKLSIGSGGQGIFTAGMLADSTDKDRICIINTGGMISMELQPDGTVDAPTDLRLFLRQFPELHAIANIDSVALGVKDSSDMNPDDWKEIAKAIYDRRSHGYKGFVVVHGTDTLPHTASAVAYALGDGLSFPVVFVGSQTAPHLIHGDARINLMRAATVAIQDDLPEVVAVVGDTIHRAVRVQKKDDYRFDGMHSPTSEPLGIIADEVYLKKGLVRQVKATSRIDFRNEFSEKIFKIGLYPGLDPDILSDLLTSREISGFILETLGLGALPSVGKWNLIPFIREAVKQNIPVLLSSQMPVQPNMAKTYQPAQAPLDAGAFAAANMSPPAAVTKFMWVLAQVDKRISEGDVSEEDRVLIVQEWMAENLIGERDYTK